ncbi:putative chlorophyll A-B binding protein [Helianthus annuus]|uniref:Chlorophyll A-B binding protein n=1 Tax=Helianthus annuus TaxID=4232 RepID=A0A251VC18_HELAN|nr:early light-induced protein 1, chloroplastic [Helianthus annuus]KAF5815771.1 putative chlorophyll A-B binding protein [Helianthus annuus]KAJ0594166.1 putative chlorophyll A-B binding protein [Helianthus annuus]KAJ0602293.1 putative chlorophyll A-B binding protein [Helianthus annuus]KAJ0609186.1 putative chlorophyll A-B binding protein [Helianthus annuus]KAJ0769258.1 putative chlorophyll A-B binding protein [Helianthus annuus]
MAATSVFMATPVARLTTTSSSSRRSLNFAVVRCTSQDQQPSTDTSKSPATPTPPPINTPPPPPPAPKVSTKFSDVLAFSGPAPERINGRLAMIGFVSALAVELSSGQDVLSQISNGGVPVFLATSLVLSVASLVPLFKGVRAESKSSGLMTSDAELLNGRVAMLGLVALAITEYVKGSALV